MLEESEEAYLQFLRSLKDRRLKTPRLVISDANTGLISEIRKGFIGASGARCKVHFMRNTLVHISQKRRKRFAVALKGIWLAEGKPEARQRANELIKKYERAFPKAIKCLEEGLEDSLFFYDFRQLASRKISSTNMLERLNRKIRRRTAVVGIFPSPDSYHRLVCAYLIKYYEDWSTSKVYLSEESLEITLSHVA